MDSQATRIREKAAALRQDLQRREEISEEIVFAEIPDGFDRVIRFSWAPTKGSYKLELRIRGWIRESGETWVPMAKVGIHVYLPRVVEFAEAVATAMEQLEGHGQGLRLKTSALSAGIARRDRQG